MHRDMTILYIATTLGVSAATVGSMESGMRRIGAADLQKLCALLQIRPAAVYDHRGLLRAT